MMPLALCICSSNCCTLRIRNVYIVFLFLQVQTVSISYLRCLIEHVRCYILDRDIELIYYTIRKSSDVLTRDPMQLGSQLISWLRPIGEHDDDDNSLLSMTVRSATAWCDGYAVPLLVPLTGWLPAPLPSQIRTMTVTGTGVIRAVCLAPSKQHLILATNSGDVQQWHIMSNSLEHTYKGKQERERERRQCRGPLGELIIAHPPPSVPFQDTQRQSRACWWRHNSRSCC